MPNSLAWPSRALTIWPQMIFYTLSSKSRILYPVLQRNGTVYFSKIAKLSPFLPILFLLSGEVFLFFYLTRAFHLSQVTGRLLQKASPDWICFHTASPHQSLFIPSLGCLYYIFHFISAPIQRTILRLFI